MIFMIGLLTCCKTHQSVIEKSTTIAVDTTAINQVAAKDSTSLNAKIDSIIIEDYAVDRSELTTDGHQNPAKHGNKKRNDTSQKESIPPKRKMKIYGVNLSSTWLSINDSLNKEMTHQATTKNEIKQKTPIRTTDQGVKSYLLLSE
jgi:hypothetical protein